MRGNFFDAIKLLLPSSPAWNITNKTHLRRLFEAIAVLPEEVRTEIELVYMDYFADSTRCLEKWEDIFAVIFTKAELEQCRKNLAVLWSMNQGGQSKTFLQTVLQGILPDIVIEENIPCANPRLKNFAYFCVCDYDAMLCDAEKALCDYREGDENFTPSILRNGTSETYALPNDAAYWAFCFYVCKSVVRNSRNEILYVERLQIPILYKDYIEYFILRVKPVHTTAVMAVEWIEE